MDEEFGFDYGSLFMAPVPVTSQPHNSSSGADDAKPQSGLSRMGRSFGEEEVVTGGYEPAKPVPQSAAEPADPPASSRRNPGSGGVSFGEDPKWDPAEPRSYAGLYPPKFPPVYQAPQLEFRFDPRKYDYDVGVALIAETQISVTREDRMAVWEAKKKLDYIHKKLGVTLSEHGPELVAAFDSAMWFCHTLNSSSTLLPGRSTFEVPDVTHRFSYGSVMAILGVDARRFFRAYADDIAEANKRVLTSLDPSDPISVENWSWLMEVAADRGITKYPYLAHDTADACMYLSNIERMAVNASRDYVIERGDQGDIPRLRKPPDILR